LEAKARKGLLIKVVDTTKPVPIPVMAVDTKDTTLDQLREATALLLGKAMADQPLAVLIPMLRKWNSQIV
jgi:ribosomal protein S12 methylthiotransferase accessory factor YcaO